MMKRLIMVCSLVWIILLAACGQKDQAPTPTATPTLQPSTATSTTQPTPTPTSTSTPTETPTTAPTETPTPVVYGPKDFPAGVNPLTGLKAADPAILNRRPVAVKDQYCASIPPTARPGALALRISFTIIIITQDTIVFTLSSMAAMLSWWDPSAQPACLIMSWCACTKVVLAYGFADEIINSRMLNSEYANRLILEGQRAGLPAHCPNPALPI